MGGRLGGATERPWPWQPAEPPAFRVRRCAMMTTRRWVGEMAALASTPQTASIMTTEPVQVLELTPQSFVALLALAPSLVEEFQVHSRALPLLLTD